MTELRFETFTIPGAPLNGESPFPAMRGGGGGTLQIKTDEQDGLFVGYGKRYNSLPHTMQDRYGNDTETLTFQSAVLENDYIRAVFLPEAGGHLWSLYDKKAKRNLVQTNPVFRPRDLALCSAWLAGGVEWNIGQIGHHALTCRPMFTAAAQDTDGTPVLRMYEFCRQRAAAYQIEFFLPDDSRFLFVRVRITNHHPYVIPMYWWSNIAVTETPGLRVITPADDTYSCTYTNDFGHAVQKLKLPFAEGFDCTYPVNFPTAKDHFFNIPPERRKFEAAIYEDGYGLIQCSTDRLQGRKLFVWGQSQGGQRWQRELTSPEAQGYAEIQAGLAHTQLEHLPMPPCTVWEWCEAYGPIQTDAAITHGNDWRAAWQETDRRLEQILPREKLDAELKRTRESFALKSAKTVMRASGWGKLEIASFGKNPWPHLDFETDDEKIEPWMALLKGQSMPETRIPASYMIQDEFFERLKNRENRNTAEEFHLGLNYYDRQDSERAEQCFLKAGDSPAALYAMANIRRNQKRWTECVSYFQRAIQAYPDITLAKESLAACTESGNDELLIRLYSEFPDDLKQIPKCRMFCAGALQRIGKWREAEAILMENGGIRVPDIREGERSLTDIYMSIRKAEAAEKGLEFKPEETEIPFSIDFRMNAVYRKKKNG